MSAVVRLVRNVVDTVQDVAEAVVNTVKAVIENPIPTIVSLAGQAIGIPAPVTMAAMTAAQGGDLGDIAKAATLSYVAPQVTSVVSSAIAPTVANAISNPAVANAVTSATSKALVNGSIAAASGGDFGDAATGTMAGSLAASGYQNLIAPEVKQQAQNLGLSVDAAKTASNVLGAGAVAGTAVAATGGDFTNGFAAGTSNALTSIAEDSVFKAISNAAANKNIAVNQPTDAGVPDSVVAQVPISPNAEPGLVINSNNNVVGDISPATNDAAYNQVLAAFQAPLSPGVGTQVGQPTAQLSGAIIPSNATATDVPIDVPQVDFIPSKPEEKMLPEVVVTADREEPEDDLLALSRVISASQLNQYTTKPDLNTQFNQQMSVANQDQLASELNNNMIVGTPVPTIDQTKSDILSAITGTAQPIDTSPMYQDVVSGADLGTQEFPISITGEPTGTGEAPTGGLKTIGTTPGTIVATPKVNLPTTGTSLEMPQMSPLSAVASTAAKNKAVYGDLGTGVVTVKSPFEWLQPSMLARGGLARFKKA